ncbi:MAG: aspartyl-phosphate phosphatase Spo0E family protein [Clostridia bacterium]|nr:aspartyl-phosphate phosphatase Spo0E family protein [Clostridia bacterium]
MVNDFEKLREKLHASIEENGLNSEKTRKISEKYNELVNIHYQKERQYNSNNIMYVKYIESVKSLRKITRDFVEFPTIKEWNHYAKENDLLNSESLKYISGSSWHDLRNKIYQNNKNN